MQNDSRALAAQLGQLLLASSRLACNGGVLHGWVVVGRCDGEFLAQAVGLIRVGSPTATWLSTPSSA